jgi:hypothetical protein
MQVSCGYQVTMYPAACLCCPLSFAPTPQDCFAGCTDPNQGFYGYMDEVRLWKTVRTQDEIMRHMRWASGLENNKDLVAYWKFNDPDTDNGQFRRHVIAKDSSGKGNDLSLINPPFRTDVEIKGTGGSLHTGKLEFKNNLAVDKTVKGMPQKSFTVEFWARGKTLSKQQTSQVRRGLVVVKLEGGKEDSICSFSSMTPGSGVQ